jgi:multicomponent Na+:H+ antiporter subunit E
MDATAYFNIILRLAIWFLLTADLSLANIIIGVAIALLLPRSYTSPGALKDWLRVLWEIVVAIPQAYIEAIQIMLRPHNQEAIVCERVKPQRTPGLIFLDIFLITFTPKTIVLKYHERGWYEVHRVIRRKSGGSRGTKRRNAWGDN